LLIPVEKRAGSLPVDFTAPASVAGFVPDRRRFGEVGRPMRFAATMAGECVDEYLDRDMRRD
jgi:hypothetical protein